MLVCSVSLRPRRPSIAADVAEISAAVDTIATGFVVFATLVDDPASVGETVDAYLGEIMVEAASANTILDASVPGVYAVDVVEAATATDTQSSALGVLLATLDGTPSNVTLSNGNLTATHSNTTNNSGARSTSQQTTGKFYFEVTINASTGAFDAFGILTSAGTYTNLVSGATNCAEVYRADGNIWTSNSFSGLSVGSLAAGAGAIFYVAVDLTARKIWFRRKLVPAGTLTNWNGDPTGNPATGTQGATFAPTVSFAPAVGFGGSGTATNDQYTVNFGQSAFDGTVPSGFSNWPA